MLFSLTFVACYAPIRIPETFNGGKESVASATVAPYWYPRWYPSEIPDGYGYGFGVDGHLDGRLPCSLVSDANCVLVLSGGGSVSQYNGWGWAANGKFAGRLRNDGARRGELPDVVGLSGGEDYTDRLYFLGGIASRLDDGVEFRPGYHLFELNAVVHPLHRTVVQATLEYRDAMIEDSDELVSRDALSLRLSLASDDRDSTVSPTSGGLRKAGFELKEKLSDGDYAYHRAWLDVRQSVSLANGVLSIGGRIYGEAVFGSPPADMLPSLGSSGFIPVEADRTPGILRGYLPNRFQDRALDGATLDITVLPVRWLSVTLFADGGSVAGSLPELLKAEHKLSGGLSPALVLRGKKVNFGLGFDFAASPEGVTFGWKFASIPELLGGVLESLNAGDASVQERGTSSNGRVGRRTEDEFVVPRLTGDAMVEADRRECSGARHLHTRRNAFSNGSFEYYGVVHATAIAFEEGSWNLIDTTTLVCTDAESKDTDGDGNYQDETGTWVNCGFSHDAESGRTIYSSPGGRWGGVRITFYRHLGWIDGQPPGLVWEYGTDRPSNLGLKPWVGAGGSITEGVSFDLVDYAVPGSVTTSGWTKEEFYAIPAAAEHDDPANYTHVYPKAVMNRLADVDADGDYLYWFGPNGVDVSHFFPCKPE